VVRAGSDIFQSTAVSSAEHDDRHQDVGVDVAVSIDSSRSREGGHADAQESAGPGAESFQSRAEVMSGRALKTIPLTALKTS
jgi:hypothetical protein